MDRFATTLRMKEFHCEDNATLVSIFGSAAGNNTTIIAIFSAPLLVISLKARNDLGRTEVEEEDL